MLSLRKGQNGDYFDNFFLGVCKAYNLQHSLTVTWGKFTFSMEWVQNFIRSTPEPGARFWLLIHTDVSEANIKPQSLKPFLETIGLGLPT